MRFMILIKATKDSEAGILPDEQLLTAMGKFNEELVNAGVLVAGEGLHPSSKGARVRFSGNKRSVTDGPFVETKELIRAGVMLAGEGLQPSSKGARVKFSGGKRTVIDGPFAETKELVAGFWLIEVRSKEEAIEWVKRVPDPMGEGEDAEIEIRQVFEAEDFGAAYTPELREQEERVRAKAAEQH